MVNFEFALLDQPDNVELLNKRGFHYIIPGEEYTADELGIEGHSDVAFAEATPVGTKPEDPVPYLELTREGICNDDYCYIVDLKYFS